MVTESALTRIRKERCREGCGKNLPMDNSRKYHDSREREPDPHNWMLCTAPSAEQLVEELAGRLAEEQKEREVFSSAVDAVNALGGKTAGTALGTSHFFGILSGIHRATETMNAAINAARAQKENADDKD